MGQPTSHPDRAPGTAESAPAGSPGVAAVDGEIPVEATKNWVVDLDGVMWRGDQPIVGSAEAVGVLLDAGAQVVFCTNNSADSAALRATELARHGVPPGFELVTSADAVASMVEPGWRILSVGGEGLAEALSAATPEGEVVDIGGIEGAAVGATALREDPAFDAVVVGLTRNFNYGILDVAAAAVRGGARLIASNADTTFPGADGLPGSGGLHPGGGSLVAAVEAASGRPAAVAGKPNRPMASAILQRCGNVGIVVGDRADTDGRLAEVLGWPFALVLSGVTRSSDLPVEVPVALVAQNLADVVAQLGPSRS